MSKDAASPGALLLDRYVESLAWRRFPTQWVALVTSAILPSTYPIEACPVANIKSQIKRNRQNDAAHERNKAVKSALKTSARRFREAADAGDADQARRLAAEATRKLDQAAAAGVIHKNQAANRKSAIARRATAL